MGLTVLDAGIVVAVLDPTDAHHAASVDALRAAQQRGDELLLPVSAYAECLVWPLRAGDTVAQAADGFIDALPIAVAPADRGVGRTAARLRARHSTSLRVPDALVVATALGSRATLILTTDRGWPAVDGVDVQVVGDPV